MDDGGENLLSETREQSFSILDPPPDGLFSIMGSSSTKLISYHDHDDDGKYDITIVNWLHGVTIKWKPVFGPI